MTPILALILLGFGLVSALSGTWLYDVGWQGISDQGEEAAFWSCQRGGQSLHQMQIGRRLALGVESTAIAVSWPICSRAQGT